MLVNEQSHTLQCNEKRKISKCHVTKPTAEQTPEGYFQLSLKGILPPSQKLQRKYAELFTYAAYIICSCLDLQMQTKTT